MTGRTLAAAHDVTMVVVGVIVGLLVIIILIAVYLFLRRRGLAQVTKKGCRSVSLIVTMLVF